MLKVVEKLASMLENHVIGTNGQTKVFTDRTTLEFPDYEFIENVKVVANEPYMAIVFGPRYTPSYNLVKTEPINEISDIVHQGSSQASYSIVGDHRGNNSYIIEIVTGGPLGTAEYRISTDGGETWTDPATVPVSGAIEIGDGTVFQFGPEGDLVQGDTYSWETKSLLELTYQTDEVVIDLAIDVYTANAKELLGDAAFDGYLKQIRTFFQANRAIHENGDIWRIALGRGNQPYSDVRAGKYRGFIAAEISGALYYKKQVPTVEALDLEVISPNGD